MTAKELLSKVENIYSDMYKGKYRQFTIDTVEDVIDELYNHITDSFQVLTDEEVIGSLIYKIETIMEICDQHMLDYKIFEELLYLMEEN